MRFYLVWALDRNISIIVFIFYLREQNCGVWMSVGPGSGVLPSVSSGRVERMTLDGPGKAVAYQSYFCAVTSFEVAGGTY